MIHKFFQSTQCAYEDLAAYTSFLKEEGGLTEQSEKSGLLQPLVNEIKPSVIGASKRSSMQSIIMAERLLKLHMKGADEQKAESIAQKLSKSYYSHGHAVSRKEALELGLKISPPDNILENYIWQIFVGFEDEMKMREPFDPRREYLKDPNASALLVSSPFLNAPSNVPQTILQTRWQQIISGLVPLQGPVLDIETEHAVVKACVKVRNTDRKSKLLGTRQNDMSIAVANHAVYAGWDHYQ